jgi:Fe-Mn family superoxide dismutase
MSAKRREFIKQVSLGGGLLTLGSSFFTPANATDIKKTSAGTNSLAEEHQLAPLPYNYDALEPVIDAETLRLHHGKHHAAYVNGLNKAEKMLAEARQSGDFNLIKHWERELAFHGSGHILHALFWTNLIPNGSLLEGRLAEAINAEFGTFDKFKAQMIAATNTVEGSGWGILAYQTIFKKLTILQTEKHQDLTLWGAIPLLVIDVWEHAYYLKYQNRRNEFIENVFKIIHWKEVAHRYEQVIS